VAEVTGTGSLSTLPQVRVEIPILVWDKGNVTIDKIVASCASCLQFDRELIGKELAASSRHVLHAALTPAAKAGQGYYFAKVETKPPAAKPILIQVKCRSRTRPVPAPGRVDLEIGLDDIPEVTIDFGYLRAKAEPALAIESSASVVPNFSITDMHLDTAKIHHMPHEKIVPVTDQLTMTLRAQKPFSLGMHEFKWVFNWTQNQPSAEVPVTIHVVPPVRPKLNELFCGILAPNQAWQGSIPLVQRGSMTELVEVKTTKPFVKATVDTETAQLRVGVVAPKSAGRHQEGIDLIFKDGRYSPIHIPLAMIVRAD
jgi:hypothetical protein